MYVALALCEYGTHTRSLSRLHINSRLDLFFCVCADAARAVVFVFDFFFFCGSFIVFAHYYLNYDIHTLESVFKHVYFTHAHTHTYTSTHTHKCAHAAFVLPICTDFLCCIFFMAFLKLQQFSSFSLSRKLWLWFHLLFVLLSLLHLLFILVHVYILLHFYFAHTNYYTHI